MSTTTPPVGDVSATPSVVRTPGSAEGSEPASAVGSAGGRSTAGLPLDLVGTCSARWPVTVAAAVLIGAVVAGVSIGPADLSIGTVARVLLAHVPLVHLHTGVTPVQSAIVWQIRMPRVVLGGIVGAMLAGGGAAYQGVFRNPLADPYLLGVAAGAGLGATLVIVAGNGASRLIPVAAFVGAAGAVAVTYTLGTQGTRSRSTRSTVSIVLAGVAVAAFLTAVQTYVQQRHAQDLQAVYS